MLWHAEGTDVDQKMLALSTYVGHAEIFYTYWYLTAVPELMAMAGEQFERFAELAGDDESEATQSYTTFVSRARASLLRRAPDRTACPAARRPWRPTGMRSCSSWTSPRRLGQVADAIKLADITPDLVLAFLDHLERAATQFRAQPQSRAWRRYGRS